MSTNPAVSEIGLISGDSHVNEPRDLWRDHLPASLRSQAMQGIQAGDDGGWNLVMDGRHIFQSSMAEEQERLRALDPDERVKIMAEDGVVAEAIFPTIGLYVWMLEDPDGGQASCEIYNDFLFDVLQSKSDRFCCAGLIPTWTPEMAEVEIERVASMGLRALMFPAVVDPFWNHSQWDRVWAAAAATGLPVVMHQGTGHDMVWYRGPGATVANLVSTQGMAPRTATILATSGILARHPNLHVVFVEFNVGWLAGVMETADYYHLAFPKYEGRNSQSRSGRSVIYPDLPELPSFYMRRQLHATFQVDTVGISNLHYTGAGCLMWGNDFPHEEGTYPNSRKLVDEQAEGLDMDIARAVFRDNALDVFGFDTAVIDESP